MDKLPEITDLLAHRKTDATDDTEDSPDPQIEATAPLAPCLREHYRLLLSIRGTMGLAARAEEVARRAGLLVGDKPTDVGSRRGGPVESMRAFRQELALFLEMALTRATDNFLFYLSELLTLAFKENPEMLKATLGQSGQGRGRQQEVVPLEDVLEYQTIDDLRQAIVERRVTNLSYRGMRSLAEYMDGQLGFAVFEHGDDLNRAVDIVERRNLIVHNRAVVNRHFLTKVPDPTRYQLGVALAFEVNAISDDLYFIANAARRIDARAATKWSLPTISIRLRSFFEF